MFNLKLLGWHVQLLFQMWILIMTDSDPHYHLYDRNLSSSKNEVAEDDTSTWMDLDLQEHTWHNWTKTSELCLHLARIYSTYAMYEDQSSAIHCQTEEAPIFLNMAAASGLGKSQEIYWFIFDGGGCIKVMEQVQTTIQRSVNLVQTTEIRSSHCSYQHSLSRCRHCI